jgi:hypothetical protein
MGMVMRRAGVSSWSVVHSTGQQHRQGTVCAQLMRTNKRGSLTLLPYPLCDQLPHCPPAPVTQEPHALDLRDRLLTIPTTFLPVLLRAAHLRECSCASTTASGGKLGLGWAGSSSLLHSPTTRDSIHFLVSSGGPRYLWDGVGQQAARGSKASVAAQHGLRRVRSARLLRTASARCWHAQRRQE